MQDQPIAAPPKIEYDLEALRGFAALVVVVSHVISYGKFLDPNYFPGKLTALYDGGHLMVLVFFVLSGFVIAISTKQRLTSSTTGQYVKKRFTRIYPIYVLSLVAALLVSAAAHSFFTILSNLTFIDVFLSNVLLDNGPIWSLHYEVLFYAAFIPLSYLSLNAVRVGVLAVVIGTANYFYAAHFHTPSLTSYCFGFAFWLSGVVVARHFAQKETRPVSRRELLSYLFLLLTIPYFNCFALAFERLSTHHYGYVIGFPYDGDISHWFKIAFTFADFSYWPYCFVGVILFINNKLRYKRQVVLLLQALPLLAICYTVQQRSDIIRLIAPLACYGISWLLRLPVKVLEAVSAYGVRFLTWVGSISYALYVFHIPVLLLFNRITFFSGSLASFGIRVVLYFGFTTLVAYLLEDKLQPLVRAFLFRSKPALQSA
ncbi:acyltransferase family protein [uncultured Hymenobacter sp.]|uniref:acyltransferase family protein n=1 Tax=uncultured Hymenobacter sp. TaxID=170016 RepID=UPI0035CA2D76